MEASRVQNDWRQRGFSSALWTDPPGQVWADFVHPVDERLLPVEGELELTVRGRTWREPAGGSGGMSRGSPGRARGERRGLNQAAAGRADPYLVGPDACSEPPAGFHGVSPPP